MSVSEPRGAESPAATAQGARRTSYPVSRSGINAEAFSLRHPGNRLWALIAAAPDSEDDGVHLPVEDWPEWADIPIPCAVVEVEVEGGEG